MEPAPLLVSFTSLPRALAALPSEIVDRHRDEISQLVEKGYPPAVSIRCIATLFGVSSDFIGALAHHPDNYYRSFTIKTGSKRRNINAPRVALKVLQKWIGHHVSHSYTWPNAVMGFVPGRSAILGASVHCPARWVYTIDIRDFFQSTHADTLVYPLSQLGYSAHAIEIITSLCTYYGTLPQGAPSSPALSNLAFASADERLIEYAHASNIKYTRYADDLVFSGQDAIPKDIQDFVRGVISSYGWEIAEEKERLSKAPQRLKVYGLLVHGDAPRLTKGYRNRLRAYRHLLKNNKIASKDLPKVLGHLAYAKSVDEFLVKQIQSLGYF